jgi:O-antigen biosynthesis protein
MRRIAIYTAIFGGYDAPLPQPPCPDVDYICFTDVPQPDAPDNWRIEIRRPRHKHPRLAAKWFKMRPDRELRSYRHTIWIDGGLRIATDTFAERAMAALDGSPVALFRHPDRDNIMDEAEISAMMPKYDGLPVLRQVEHYRKAGYPATNGLYAGGVLVRDGSDRRIRRLNRLWMRENLKWTYQDQLSLPYLFWKLDIEPGVIPYDLWDNPLFDFVPHASEL